MPKPNVFASARALAASVVIWTLLASACDGERDRADRTPEHPVDGPPVLEVDTVLSIHDDRLWRVQSLGFSGDRVVVLNGGSREVFLYGPDGELELSFGGLGQGPGEFGYLRGLAVSGDTLYVVDSLFRRLSRFVRGELHSTWSLGGWARYPEFVGIRGDGSPVVAIRGQQPLPPGLTPSMGPVFYRDPIHLITSTAESPGEWSELFSVPGHELRVIAYPGGRGSLASPVFWADLLYGFAEDGVIGVERRTGEIVFHDWGGETTTIRGAPPPTYASEAEIATWRGLVEETANQRAARGEDRNEIMSAALTGIERWDGRVPRPVFDALVTDGEVIAVQEFQQGNPLPYAWHPRRWLGIDRNGSEWGRWTVPENVRILAIDDRRLAAVAVDSLEVESLLVLRLQEP